MLSPRRPTAARAALLAAALLALVAALVLPAAAPAAETDPPIVVTLGDDFDEPDYTNGGGACEIRRPDEASGDPLCTLRAAMQTANARPGKDTIAFDLETGPGRIRPSAVLPVLTEPTVIDGWSQGGTDPATGIPPIEIDGSRVPMPNPGEHTTTIRVNSPYGIELRGDGSAIRGLAVHGFKSSQITVTNADSSTITGSWIGLDRAGQDAPGDAIAGVYVYNTINATIGGATKGTRNVVSGSHNGILVTGSRSIANLVHGNYVGTDPTGLRVIGHTGIGILVTTNAAAGAAEDTVVAGNLVAGSGTAGVRVIATGTKVIANWVGLNVNGLARDAADRSAGQPIGIDVLRAADTLVGGAEEAWGNVVATSAVAGIRVFGDATDTKIETNIVGTDPEGVATTDWMGNPTGGADAGIAVVPGSNGDAPLRVTIGGPDPTYANLSSGHDAGIAVLGGATDVTVQHNQLGTDLVGHRALPNEVGLLASPENEGFGPVPERLRVGTPGAGNVISGNEKYGVVLERTTTSAIVQANKVGVGVDGRPLGNGAAGIGVAGSEHLIGGRGEGEGNLVSANGEIGIAVIGRADDTKVRGNRVGTPPGGAAEPGKDPAPWGNGDGGIALLPDEDGFEAPRATTIGGTLPGEGNVVSGNGGAGIEIRADVTETVVQRNLVGTDVTGEVPLGNRGSGIDVHGADTLIGGTIGEDSGNVVSGNREHGIRITDTRAAMISGNTIGSGADGSGDVGNGGDGVHVAGDTDSVVVGWEPAATDIPAGVCVERCNLIAYSGGAGVAVPDDETETVAVRGNELRGNTGQGIDLGDTGPDAIDPQDDDQGANGLLNPPAGVHGTRDRRTGETAITGQLPYGAPDETKIDLYGLSRAPAAERAREGTYLGTVTPDEQGNFVLRTEDEWLTYAGVAVAPDGTTSETSLICSDSDQDGSSDRDGDALCDDWETRGIDFDADGYPDHELQDADPGKADIYVEIDYTEGAFWGLAGDAAPSLGALREVRAAFADAPREDHPHGIDLHFDRETEVDEELPRIERLAVSERRPGPLDDVRDLRYGEPDLPCDGRFGSPGERTERWCFTNLGAKGLAYRYAVFTERLHGSSAAGGTAGGDAVVIGLGHWSDEQHLRVGGGEGTCVTARICRRANQSAVLMHELGHALGLEHGGESEAALYAPNYLSVMNAPLTFPFLVPERPLDFSRDTLATLREDALAEPAGIGGAGGPNDPEWPASIRMGHDPDSDTCAPVPVAIEGPVDWNGDGDRSDTGLATSINEADADADAGGREECEAPGAALEVLKGHDDWAKIQFDARAVRSTYDGEDRDAEGLDSDLLRLGDVADTDGDGVPNDDDVCTRAADPDQEDADDDGIGDACLPLIAERDVQLTLASSDADPHVGRALTVTATLRNDYPLPATGLAASVPLPAGWTLEEASASTGTYDAASGAWSVPALDKRAEATLTLKVVPAVEGERTLVAELTAAGQPDPDSSPTDHHEHEDDRATLAFDPLPTEVVLDVADARVQEGNRARVTARVRLTLRRTWRRPVTVAWKTVDGTAKAGDDYVAGEGTLTLPAGERELRVDVPVEGDRLVEERETFGVALTADGAQLAKETATVTIADNDAPSRPGQLDFLGCVSEDEGPLSRCQTTAKGLRSPNSVLAADGRFMYALSREHVVVLERSLPGAPPVVRQCLFMANDPRSNEDCERVPPGNAQHTIASALSPDGRFLYLLTQHSGSGSAVGLTVLARDAQTGRLTMTACYAGHTGCQQLDGIRQLDPVRGGVTELAISPDGRQLLAIPTARPDAPGRLWTWERSVDGGTLAGTRCYDEGTQSEAPCVPLDVEWGSSAAAAPAPAPAPAASAPGWLLRTTEGLASVARHPETGELTPGPCVLAATGDACADLAASVGGAGDLVTAADGTAYVGSDARGTLTTLRRDGERLRLGGCVQDAEVADRDPAGCAAQVEGAAGLRGLQVAPDGRDVYASARGGGLLALARGDGGELVAGQCIGAETEHSTCGGGSVDVAPGASFTFTADGREVWTAVQAAPEDEERPTRVLARFVRFRAGDGENLAPFCVGGTARTQPGREVEIALRCSDPDGDPVQMEVTAQPTHGTLALRGTEGAGTYAPAAGFAGVDTIRFRASDGRVVSEEAVLEVRVEDLAPVCESGDRGMRVPVEERITVDCRDPEGGPVTVEVVTPPSLGTLTPLPEPGAFTFRFLEKRTTETAFEFVAKDAAGNASEKARLRLILHYPYPQIPDDLGSEPPKPPSNQPQRPPSGGGGGGRRPGGQCSGSSCRPDARGNVPVVVTCPKNEAGECVGEVVICEPKGCRRAGPRATTATASGDKRKPKAAAPRGVLGRATFKVPAGTSKTVKVRLSAAARRRLAKTKSRRMTAVLQVTLRQGSAAKPTVTTSRVTLQAPKPPKKQARKKSARGG